MCGICGRVDLHGRSDPAATVTAVDAMLAALQHRGPNGSGATGDSGVRLGASRLAIRALDDGAQPIVDPDTGIAVVCNGEIDNHQELRQWLAARGRPVRQAVDVAVIPGLYRELGEAFVDRLVGVFAVAVWDPRSRSLLLARDRAGERSLFYTEADGIISFASEVAALVSAGDGAVSVDTAAFQHFLQFGYFAHGKTPFRGVHRLPPAQVVTFRPDGRTERQFWRWSPAETPPETPSISAFDTVFADAVERQSTVDVPLGVFLSGGVDSSLVAAMTRKQHAAMPVTAYTLRFAEQSYDESDWAKTVAESLNMPHVGVDVRPDDFPGMLPDIIRHCGEPLADPAWIPTTLLARRAAEDVRVAMIGEGADELFGGYPTYIGAVFAERYAALPRPVRGAIRGAVEHWPVSDKKVTLSFLLKRFVQAAEMDGIRRHRIWTSNIPPANLKRLGLQGTPVPPAADEARIIDLVQQLDFETSLAEGLLIKADRAGMRWGLETRAPFLDVDVMDFAARLPTSARVRGTSTKTFLKQFACRYLPRTVVHRRKRGLSVPLAAWLRGPLEAWARERLAAPALADLGVSLDGARGLMDEHRSRTADHARTLWTLVVAAEWLNWNGGR